MDSVWWDVVLLVLAAVCGFGGGQLALLLNRRRGGASGGATTPAVASGGSATGDWTIQHDEDDQWTMLYFGRGVATKVHVSVPGVPDGLVRGPERAKFKPGESDRVQISGRRIGGKMIIEWSAGKGETYQVERPFPPAV